MTLNQILSTVESEAEQRIEVLRQQIIMRILAAKKFDGPVGQSLRASVEQIVQGNLSNAPYQFHANIQNAWAAGIERAEKGLEKSHSMLIPDTAHFQEALRRSFQNLTTSISEKVNNVLLRASLNDHWTRDKVIDMIGTSSDGLFSEFKSRALGIVDYVIQTTESTAFARRLRELQRVLAQQKAPAKADTQKLSTLIIKYWNHSTGGNPPRANHEAMDGKGVPADMKFTLVGRDGEKLLCEEPHDAALPVGEVANCHCTAITVPIKVTKDEEETIRSRAESTGGFRDKRWG